ncbi:MAG: YoaK family protein [Oscillospiraceae bacterium]
MVETESKNIYLTCEKRWIFELLMLCSGMMGAYTFVLRGGVFCNAQTANFVMMAVEFGKGHWLKGCYFFIPAAAYFSGTFISEIVPKPVKRFGLLRWDTCLIAVEMIVLFVVGWIPLSVPDQVVQVSINFIASMQYNTFRQAEGIPMATTFCTNHVRQLGVGVAKYVRKNDKPALQKGLKHGLMIGCFFVGGVIVSLLTSFIGEKAIWIAILPLLYIFIQLVYADLVSEHDQLDKKPHGH